MPLWNCDFHDCCQASVRTLGECVLCDRHLCSRHLQAEFHNCPRWEDADAYDPKARDAEKKEITSLIEKINIDSLASRASDLRQGLPCSIPTLQYDRAKRSSIMGGMNYHIEIHFDDGIVWIARIRRFNATSPPAALRDYIVLSEVATLKFLQQTKVPSPKIYDFSLDCPENPVGVGFILMEKMPGKSLRWASTTEQQRERVMSQLADTFVELSNYSFDCLGSLDKPGELHVGAFARESLTDFAGHKMLALGPFSSLKDYHTHCIRFILSLIIRKEMYTQRPVDSYLVHLYLLEILPHILPDSLTNDTKFYLKHADDKGDHILVDDHFNITGIIDWEWAHTASPANAFNSPIGFLHVGDFYDGKNTLSEDEVTFSRLLEEKGRSDLANYVKNGRIQHRFAFCCGYDLEDWAGFLGLFKGLRDAVGVDNGLGWDEWKAVALQRFQDDHGLQKLLAEQEA